MQRWLIGFMQSILFLIVKAPILFTHSICFGQEWIVILWTWRKRKNQSRFWDSMYSLWPVSLILDVSQTKVTCFVFFWADVNRDTPIFAYSKLLSIVQRCIWTWSSLEKYLLDSTRSYNTFTLSITQIVLL